MPLPHPGVSACSTLGIPLSVPALGCSECPSVLIRVSSGVPIAGVGSLLARFQLSEGPSSPAPLAVQFTSEGSTLSSCDIELVGAGYRFSLIKKRFAAGGCLTGGSFGMAVSLQVPSGCAGMLGMLALCIWWLLKPRAPRVGTEGQQLPCMKQILLPLARALDFIPAHPCSCMKGKGWDLQGISRKSFGPVAAESNEDFSLCS